jgi:hypothetical protein
MAARRTTTIRLGLDNILEALRERLKAYRRQQTASVLGETL